MLQNGSRLFKNRFYQSRLLLITILFLLILSSFRGFSDEQEPYLQTLQQSAFNRYVNQPAGYSSMIDTPTWDAYLFKEPEYQCVMGDDFGLLDRDPNLKIGLFTSYGDSVVANAVGMDTSLYK